MRFPPPPRLLATSTLAAACLGAGFILGHRHATRPPPDARAPLASIVGTPARPPNAPAPPVTRPADKAPARWSSLQNLPATPDSEARQCAHLLALAAVDPAAALQLADSAPTPRQRELLRNAALQGWAGHDPLAAAEWTIAHVRSDKRRAAVKAVAAGAISRPDAAVEAISRLISADPILASDHGTALVAAFARAGRYDEAARFAATGPEPCRAAWLSTAYQQWGSYQPRAALLALDRIADPASRREARSGLYAGWSLSDPATLVAHAQSLPRGDARLDALNNGLSQWVHRDPAAASAWMDHFDPSPDLDAGAAAIALAPALVAQNPDVAASWAESITDPELRAHTLLDLIRAWAEHDAPAALNYATRSPTLPPETRALALSTLQPQP